MTEFSHGARMTGVNTARDGKPGLRRDLQGARGIGVALVVVGHLWRWPGGAYAMLDMFFVFSGFFITAILIKMLRDHGPLFLFVFALGRVRRLMPAAITVIVATVALTYLVFSTAKGDSVAKDGVWALLLVANWHFAASDADYFQDDHTSSPLIHYWSLSIEEQFYAVWPLFVLLLITIAGRRRIASTTTTLALGIGGMTAAAFLYSLWHSVESPVAAYYSTFDRAWEIGIGGLLAVFASRLARLPSLAGRAVSWGGLVALLITVLLLPSGIPFPAPYGLLPTLCASAIIVGGMERDTRYIGLLDNRPMIYLGDLSYSIYLVHLPVNVLLLPFFADRSSAYYGAVISVTCAASLACYYLVERPMRRARWLMTKAERAQNEGVRRRTLNWARLQQVGFTTLVAGVLVVVVATLMRPTFLIRETPASAARSSSGDPNSDLPNSPSARQKQSISAALSAMDFPNFEPGLEELNLESWTLKMSGVACTNVTPATATDCNFGDVNASNRAVVMGDSFAMAWMPGILDALLPKGWNVQQFTYSWCPTWTLASYVTPTGEESPACAAVHTEFLAYIERVQPELIILASGAEQVGNAGREGVPEGAVEIATQGLSKTLDAIHSESSQTVVLAPPPGHANLVECVSRVAGPESCVTQPVASWYDHLAGESIAASAADALYVITENWFCVERKCPAFVGDTPVTVDGGHLTVEFSQQLAPLLRRVLMSVASEDKVRKH